MTSKEINKYELIFKIIYITEHEFETNLIDCASLGMSCPGVTTFDSKFLLSVLRSISMSPSISGSTLIVDEDGFGKRN